MPKHKYKEIKAIFRVRSGGKLPGEMEKSRLVPKGSVLLGILSWIQKSSSETGKNVMEESGMVNGMPLEKVKLADMWRRAGEQA